MKRQITYSMANSIYTWIVKRNSCFYIFKDSTVNKIKKIIENGNKITRQELELSVEEADSIISALYANSGVHDSSVPKDEIKFLTGYLLTR